MWVMYFWLHSNVAEVGMRKARNTMIVWLSGASPDLFSSPMVTQWVLEMSESRNYYAPGYVQVSGIALAIPVLQSKLVRCMTYNPGCCQSWKWVLNRHPYLQQNNPNCHSWQGSALGLCPLGCCNSTIRKQWRPSRYSDLWKWNVNLRRWQEMPMVTIPVTVFGSRLWPSSWANIQLTVCNWEIGVPTMYEPGVSCADGLLVNPWSMQSTTLTNGSVTPTTV